MELLNEIDEGIIILTAHGTDLELINKMCTPIKEQVTVKETDTGCHLHHILTYIFKYLY